MKKTMSWAHSRIGVTAFLVFVLLFPCASWGNSDPVTLLKESPGTRRALLIGISQYYALETLEGAVNDVALIRHVLMTRYGFTEEHIRLLTNGAATRGAILHELRTLVRETQPGDVVYIHYSGHGSQVRDLNGDEGDDHMDETLVPVNGRTPGIPDITDDELEELVSKLQSHATIITVDACHSGTITRGVAIHTRSVPPDTRLDLYRAQTGNRRGKVVETSSFPYVLMTGASAHEKALDAPVNGIHYGFFSYALSKSLSRLPVEASTQEVFHQSQKELLKLKNLIGRRTIASPQLESPPERLQKPLFPLLSMGTLTGVKATPHARLPWLSVHPTEKNTVVLEKAGELGVQAGSIWGIYRPGERLFHPNKAQAYATVIEQKGLNAIAKLSPEGIAIAKESRAVRMASAAKEKGLRILFRDVESQNQDSWEKAIFDENERVQIVSSGEYADYVMDETEETIRISSADGEEELGTYQKTSMQQVAKPLTAALVRDHNIANVSWIENHVTQIRLTARIAGIPKNQSTSTDRLADPVLHIRKSEDSRSLVNSLQVEVESNTDGYLTIVDIDQMGLVNVIFPNAAQRRTFYPEGFVTKGERVRIPDSLENPNQAGFHWDIGGLTGKETLWVFLNTDRTGAMRLRKYVKTAFRPAEASGKRGGPSSEFESHITGLRKELLQQLTGTPFPTSSTSAFDHATHRPPTRHDYVPLQSDWTAISLNVMIMP